MYTYVGQSDGSLKQEQMEMDNFSKHDIELLQVNRNKMSVCDKGRSNVSTENNNYTIGNTNITCNIICTNKSFNNY